MSLKQKTVKTTREKANSDKPWADASSRPRMNSLRSSRRRSLTIGGSILRYRRQRAYRDTPGPASSRKRRPSIIRGLAI
jgi:hypothetical protein